MRGVGSIAGSGFAQATARMARSAYDVAKTGSAPADAGPVLAERAPGGVARSQLARQVSPNLDAVPFHNYHGEAGAVADATRETVEQVGSVNAYKTYLAVFRADDEIKSSLVKIKA